MAFAWNDLESYSSIFSAAPIKPHYLPRAKDKDHACKNQQSQKSVRLVLIESGDHDRAKSYVFAVCGVRTESELEVRTEVLKLGDTAPNSNPLVYRVGEKILLDKSQFDAIPGDGKYLILNTFKTDTRQPRNSPYIKLTVNADYDGIYLIAVRRTTDHTIDSTVIEYKDFGSGK